MKCIDDVLRIGIFITYVCQVKDYHENNEDTLQVIKLINTVCHNSGTDKLSSTFHGRLSFDVTMNISFMLSSKYKSNLC